VESFRPVFSLISRPTLYTSGRLVGKRSGAGVDLFGFEVIEDLVDRFIFGDDGDDFHLGTAGGTCERDPEDAL